MIPAPLLQSTDPASALGEPDPDGIYRIDETDSVLTLARSLYAADRLPVYGSIFANLQTAGRGQSLQTCRQQDADNTAAHGRAPEGIFMPASDCRLKGFMPRGRPPQRRRL